MLVVLGNQLFPLHHLPEPGATPVFMAEDLGLCTYEKHHQQKIVLFLAAMRAYADELRAAGYDVGISQRIGEDRWLKLCVNLMSAPNALIRREDHATRAFVEIKARTSADFGEAIRAVTPRKQRQIAAAATLYLAARPYPGPCRFDVLANGRRVASVPVEHPDGWHPAEADLTASEGFVDHAMAMNPDAGAIIGMGYLRKNGEVYEMHAEYAKGLLTINGAPMPIPMGQ